jgi:hypothetical protein
VNRLFDIASKLDIIARQRFALRRFILDTENQIIAREAAMIPEGGWPGGNADTRKAMEKAAKSADPELQKLITGKEGYQTDLDNLELEKDALVNERSAWEWTIRDRETQTSDNTCFNQSVFEAMDLFQDEQEQRNIDELYQLSVQEEAEANREREAADQPKLDFEPGSVDDPSSPNYIPF